MLRRFCTPYLFLMAVIAPAARGQQTATPSLFQEKAQAAITSGKSFHVLNLTANAEWVAGSQHESGTAQLMASVDGSTNVQLNLGQASRTEVQTAANPFRTCTWSNSAGTSYSIMGANCFIAIPWFAPGLFTQSSSVLPALLTTSDDGEITKDNEILHQVRFLLNRQGMNTASTQQLIALSTVKVFYNPQTLLPDSLEYNIHPDDNDLQNIDVKVVFSNYQSVSGMMVPFHIERYIHHTLQLTLNISNAVLE
jgi:hypothetical protein